MQLKIQLSYILVYTLINSSNLIKISIIIKRFLISKTIAIYSEEEKMLII